MLTPGSQALRRPLPLDTLAEEMARLWRVGEGIVSVDLAGESLIERRHFRLFVNFLKKGVGKENQVVEKSEKIF